MGVKAGTSPMVAPVDAVPESDMWMLRPTFAFCFSENQLYSAQPIQNITVYALSHLQQLSNNFTVGDFFFPFLPSYFQALVVKTMNLYIHAPTH